MFASYLKRTPFLLKPIIPVYGFVVGVFLYFFYALVHYTCRITVNKVPVDAGRAVIYSTWHRNINLNFSTFVSAKNEAWMNHPLPYMAPWYFLAKLKGISTMIPGSTGNDGRAAADELVRYLKLGHTTCITPDGPAGPPGVLKKGILHIAEQSGAPVIGLSFSYRRCLIMPTWDKKILPIPFISRIHAQETGPFFVTPGSHDEILTKITAALN